MTLLVEPAFHEMTGTWLELRGLLHITEPFDLAGAPRVEAAASGGVDQAGGLPGRDIPEP